MDPDPVADIPKEDKQNEAEKSYAIEDMIFASIDEEPLRDCNASDSQSYQDEMGDDDQEVQLSDLDDIEPVSDPGDMASETGDMASETGENHEFEIIDELESDEEKEGGQTQDKRGDGDFTDESDLDDSELHALLEKNVTKDSIKDKIEPTIKHKIILKELDTDPFDILPPGWIVLTHNSGMPVYLHKDTRVVTMAKPYCLGNASTRGHDIPISAIPCMQYKQQLEKLGLSQNKADGNCDENKEANELIQKTNEENLKNSCDKNDKIDEISNEIKQELQDDSEVKKCPFSSPRKVWCPSDETSKEVNSSIDGAKDAVINGLDLKNPDLGQSSNMKWVSSNGSFKRVPINQSNSDETTSVVASDSDKCLSQTNPCESKSVPEENIAVSLDTSTVLDGKEKPNEECEDESGLEDGEIDEGADEDDDVLKEPSIHSKKYRSKKQQSKASQPNETTSESKTDKNGLKVPQQEEAAGSEEPSEMVTSGTNTLAAIKRKLDNLKNKHGGKQRKLDEADRAEKTPEVNLAVDSSKTAPQPLETLDLNVENDALVKKYSETKIKTAEERAKDVSINPDAVYNYCTRLFQFKTIEVKKYSTWRDRREHLKKLSSKRPELPKSTKLLTCPVTHIDPKTGVKKKHEFVLNPSGKSYLCILHEYMQRTMKTKPLYNFKELVNSQTPYGATVSINNVNYGTGYASSKKVAKQEAAKETLKIIIPDLFKKLTDQEIKRSSVADLSFFDEIEVTDPRVTELGNKVGQPGPYQILLECLKRNFGMGNTNCKITTKSLKNQKCEFTIEVGKHTAQVIARNKRDGKQFASQAILAKLHPHIHNWGSLLRLYATNIEKPVEKVEQLNEIKTHTANKKVLDSLRIEMKKLYEQKEAIRSKGKITVPSKALPSKMTRLDL